MCSWSVAGIGCPSRIDPCKFTYLHVSSSMSWIKPVSAIKEGSQVIWPRRVSNPINEKSTSSVWPLSSGTAMNEWNSWDFFDRSALFAHLFLLSYSSWDIHVQSHSIEFYSNIWWIDTQKLVRSRRLGKEFLFSSDTDVVLCLKKSSMCFPMKNSRGATEYLMILQRRSKWATQGVS